MDTQTRPSISDGFWMSLLVSGPLLALAAFPYAPRAVSTGALIICAFLATGWVALPSLRWAWRYLREVRETAMDLAVTRRMSRQMRMAILENAPRSAGTRYPRPR